MLLKKKEYFLAIQKVVNLKNLLARWPQSGASLDMMRISRFLELLGWNICLSAKKVLFECQNQQFKTMKQANKVHWESSIDRRSKINTLRTLKLSQERDCLKNFLSYERHY